MQVFNHCSICEATQVNVLTLFASVIVIFIIGQNNARLFEVKPVRSIEHAYGNKIITKEAIQSHPFHNLTYAQQSQLCEDAWEYASKNEIILKQINKKNVELNEYTIFQGLDDEQSTDGRDRIGLRCPTIPSVLLVPTDVGRNSVNKMSLFVERNPFLEYVFAEEVIASFNRKVDIVAQTDLLNFNEIQKWELCAAAKNSVEYNITMLANNEWSEKVVGLIDIVYPNGIKVDFETALECNSSPKMYLRKLRNNSINAMVVFMVMLIEDEISPNSRHNNGINVSSQENFVSASACNDSNCSKNSGCSN